VARSAQVVLPAAVGVLIAAACGSPALAPTSPDSAVVVKNCGSLASNTTYVLNQDLPAASGSQCLQLVGVTSVTLDCQGHAVTSVGMTNVGGITVRNCTVTGGLAITGSNAVTVTASTISGIAAAAVSGAVVVFNSSLVVLDHSTINAPANAGVAVGFQSSTNDQLVSDTISIPGNSGDEAIRLFGGSGNQVLQNTIASTYAGTVSRIGTDDGVLIDNETGDTVRGNTITGFWDTGVEGVDSVANTTVADNVMSKIGTAAIGSYWCTNWTNDVIQHNDVGQAPRLVLVNYQTATPQCVSPFAAPAFTGNQFIDNRFHDLTPGLGFLNIPKMSVVLASGDVENNLLRGNDFGSNDGPFLSPLAGFVDGGGNVCGPMNPSLSNFPCMGSPSGDQRHRRR
jgi:hypothetical protein